MPFHDDAQRADVSASSLALDVPPGAVRVQPNPDQRDNLWYLVIISRPKYVKRFNLSPDEAAQLRDALTELL